MLALLESVYVHIVGSGEWEEGRGEKDLRQFFAENGGLEVLILNLTSGGGNGVAFEILVLFGVDPGTRFFKCLPPSYSAKARMDQALEENLLWYELNKKAA